MSLYWKCKIFFFSPQCSSRTLCKSWRITSTSPKIQEEEFQGRPERMVEYYYQHAFIGDEVRGSFISNKCLHFISHHFFCSPLHMADCFVNIHTVNFHDLLTTSIYYTIVIFLWNCSLSTFLLIFPSNTEVDVSSLLKIISCVDIVS